MSGHNPLLFCTKQEKNVKQKSFSLKTSWFKHKGFVPKVKEIWGKSVLAKKMLCKSGLLNSIE